MVDSRKAWLLAAVAGASAACFWLPLGLSPLFPLAFFCYDRALALARDQRQAVKVGLAFGLLRYAVASHFLLAAMAFHPLASGFYLVAILYTLPFSIFESWGSKWLEERTGAPRGLSLAVLFTLGEKLRTYTDLSMPADMTSHGLAAHPEWIGWSSVGGPYAAGFWAAGVGVLLGSAWALRSRNRRRFYALGALALMLWIAPRLVDPLFRPEPGQESASMRVSIVQPFVKVPEKTNDKAWPKLWTRLDRLTRRAARDADLILWPESTRPGPVIWQSSEPIHDKQVEQLSREIGVPILYGANLLSYEKTQGKVVGQRIYNGAALVTPQQGTVDWYGKQRLVPFAEGVPFGKLLGWDPAKRKRGPNPSLLTMLGNFSAGPKPTVFRVGDARIGVLICYEAFYPELARRYRLDGANTLVELTNDAWWGHSVFPSWHGRMAGARARELNLPVVRAANNGISSNVDAKGETLARSKLDAVTILDVDLQPSTSGLTFYARTGDLLTPSLLLVLATTAAVGIFRRRRGATGRKPSS